MKLLAASSLLAVWAAMALAAPPSPPSALHARATGGPCDLSDEDTGCYLIMDDSGCFLDTSNTSRVLGCADPDPTTAIDIFCRCWGCNGQELVHFMPTLNCTSKTVIPKPVPVGGGNSTKSTNATTPAMGKGKGTTAAGETRMPVPILPNGQV